MTYLEAYMQLNTVEEIKQAAIHDAKVEMFLNTDRIKFIEEEMNEAIKELEEKNEFI